MCGAGDARKIVTFVPNCHNLEQKVQLFFQNALPRARAPNNKNKIVAHPTNHGNALLILAQYNNQPTISRY
jgi:hypothetical protein